MRREPAFLDGQDGVLVYIAKKLKESLALEELLTASGVDYVVEVDYYLGGLIFRRSRAGAFFYVPKDAAERTREVMLENGYRPYEALGPSSNRHFWST